VSIFGKKTGGFEVGEGLDPNRPKKTMSENQALPTPEKLKMPPVNPQPPMVQKTTPPQGANGTAAFSPATLSPQGSQKEGTEGGRTPSPYSIEDVIRLMRELPDSKKEMVVIIVQKTLLSAKIDIHSILEDAGRKVEKLQRQNDKMVSEIRELEEAIIQKKGEVDRLARDIEETNGVKQVFEVVYGRHVKTEMEAPGGPGMGSMGMGANPNAAAGPGMSSTNAMASTQLPEKDKSIPPATPSIKIF